MKTPGASALLLPGVSGSLGMLAGWLLDTRGAGPALLMAQCGAASTLTLTDALYLHWSRLPAMHVGMVVAGLMAVMLRGVFRPGTVEVLRVEMLRCLVCTAWMLLGMSFGPIALMWTAPVFGAGAGLHHGAMVMPASMVAGMLGGMLMQRALALGARQVVLRFDGRHLMRA